MTMTPEEYLRECGFSETDIARARELLEDWRANGMIMDRMRVDTYCSYFFNPKNEGVFHDNGRLR
jgi:hypothetical protein